MQYSTSVRNARLDAMEQSIGASPTLRIRTGAPPATCQTADSGTVIATVQLPADWLAPAAGGTKSLSGVWRDASADAAGTAGHFRIYDAGGTCDVQGTCGIAGSGADMILQNTNFQAGQEFTVTRFDITEGNG